jgi:hypothetical protein
LSGAIARCTFAWSRRMLAAALLALLALDVSAAPDACPAEAEVAAAVAARLPADPRATAGWRLSVAPIAGGERAVLLELADATGMPRLGRTLAIGESTCRSIADAVALVVERYFSELGSGEDAAAERARMSPAPAPAPVLEARPRLEAIGAAGGGHYAGLGPRAALELRARIVGAFELGAGVGLPATRTEAITGGTGSARLISWPLRLTAGAVFAIGTGRALGVAADALFSVESARTEGIPHVADNSRTTLGLGASLTAMQRLSRRFRVGIELAAHRDAGPAFMLDGQNGTRREVLEVPSWDLLASVRVGFALLP